MVRDGIVFKDEDGQVIFNQHSFCELVKHLLVELVGISYEEASQIVECSPPVSYTHLDVYKRQVRRRVSDPVHMGRWVGLLHASALV